MHSMLSVDGKEPKAAKGANISTEFKEYEGALVNKKVMRRNMR